MDYTSRMAALLGRFRRERNGVVADTMQYRGKAYGLNYGVSLPTIRAVARAERPDSDFARFLYRQDVRELKLAAFWIADPVQVTSVEFSDWGEGIANSEMAEECAFALMSRSPRGDEWGRAWCDTGNELLGYAGLLALSRIPHPDFSSLVPVLRRLVVTYPESNLVAQGVVALLAAIMTNPGRTTAGHRNIPLFARAGKNGPLHRGGDDLAAGVLIQADVFDCFDLFLERQQFLIGQRAFAASDLIPFAEVDQRRRRADHITVEQVGILVRVGVDPVDVHASGHAAFELVERRLHGFARNALTGEKIDHRDRVATYYLIEIFHI